MSDERSDGPQRVLSGFLSETTRRVRPLLAVTTVAIGTKVFGVRFTKLSLLGNELTISDERWLPIGLFVAVLYFCLLLGLVHGVCVRGRPAS